MVVLLELGSYSTYITDFVVDFVGWLLQKLQHIQGLLFFCSVGDKDVKEWKFLFFLSLLSELHFWASRIKCLKCASDLIFF